MTGTSSGSGLGGGSGSGSRTGSGSGSGSGSRTGSGSGSGGGTGVGNPSGLPTVTLTLGATDATYQIRFDKTTGVSEVTYETSATLKAPTETDLKSSTATEISLTTEAPRVIVRFKLDKDGKKMSCSVEFTGLAPGRDAEKVSSCIN